MSGSGDRLARGTIFSISAQLAAAALGFALTIFLARHLGPTVFGRYGVIISFLAWAEFLVITGIPDAVSRTIAAEGERRRAVFRTGLLLEVVLAAGLFVLFWISAPWFSAWLFHNPSLAGAFRLAALDIPLYALFSVHLGYIRGVRGFARQSWCIGFYAAAKVFSSAVLVLAGFSLSGALVGNAVGSLAALVLARLLVTSDIRRASPSGSFPAASLLAYALPLVAGVLLYNALISTDLWMVERLVAEDGEVGLYTAVWHMARTPYYLFMGLSVVLFPGLSRVLAAGDAELACRQVGEATRLFLLVAVPLVLFSATTGSGLMDLAFSKAYAPHRSGPLFSALIAGYTLLSFGLIYSSALSAARRLGTVVLINLLLLSAQITLTQVLIPRFGLSGAILSTLLTGSAAFLVGQVSLSRFFGARLRLLPLVRMVAAALPAVALTLVLPCTGWMLILAYASCSLVYLAGLFILGELTWDEFLGYGAQFRSRR